MNFKIKRIVTVIMCIVLIVFTLVGCGNNKDSKIEQKSEVKLSKDAKILVVYFSWSGHLKTMSNWIGEETGGDVVRVVTKEEYPKDYDKTADRAKNEKDEGKRPEIIVEIDKDKFSQYDTIFFGFPIWWYDMPMAMCTFLESYDFSKKTIIPFFSHEGSSDGASSLDTLEKLAKGADVKKDNPLSIKGGIVDSSKDKVVKWVKDLGYNKK